MDRRRVATSAGELAVVDAGDPQAPPVVLLHGFPTSSHLWRRLVPMLAPWMRVIAPDLLGAGESDAPAEADYRLVAHRDRVAEVLEALGVERFAALGHAEGGGLAQLLAVDGRVDALCLIDSIAFDAWPSDAVRALQASLLEGAGPERIEGWVRSVFERGRAQPGRAEPGGLEASLRPFSVDRAAEAFAAAAAGLDGTGLEDLEPALAALDVPALVLWGEEDAFLDVALAERLGEVLPRAAVAVLPGCGHYLLEDAPDTVAPLIFQWLRSQYLGVEHRHDAGPVVVSLGRRPEEGREGDEG